MTQTETQPARFTTSDGVTIDGDLRIPTSPSAAAIICHPHPHPHPQYGGNRYNKVVHAMFDALPAAGIAALRFDFRTEYDDGRSERLDAVAALDHLATEVPNVQLASMPAERGMDVTTLILTSAHDQFSTPDATEVIISEWPQTTHETIASTDHFLGGCIAQVAERAVRFLR